MNPTPTFKDHVVKGRFKKTWQLQTAKASFSQLFRLVRSEGPQWITRQGKDAVVMLSAEQFEQLVKKSAGTDDLADFFAHSPMYGLDITFKRGADYGRDVVL